MEVKTIRNKATSPNIKNLHAGLFCSKEKARSAIPGSLVTKTRNKKNGLQCARFQPFPREQHESML